MQKHKGDAGCGWALPHRSQMRAKKTLIMCREPGEIESESRMSFKKLPYPVASEDAEPDLTERVD
jgi:hypothetical protein